MPRMTPKRDSHCSFCGAAFAEGLAWPRTCAACQSVSYKNPLPVACVLLPVIDGDRRGLLLIRRGIPPQIGKLAVPGGFIGVGESWQVAGARELFEETRVRIDPETIKDFRVLSAPDGTVLIFGEAPAIDASALPPFTPTDETTERPVVFAPEPLAFPLHTRVVEELFARDRRGEAPWHRG